MDIYAKNIRKYKELLQRKVRKSTDLKLPLYGCDCNKDIQHTENTAKVSNQKCSKVYYKEGGQQEPLNPFYLPQHDRMFHGIKLKKKLKKTVREPHRKETPFIMSDPRTICDVDENFYKIIEGRPLRQFIDRKVYMADIRNITQTRAMIAYKRDEIAQIDNYHADEVEEYNQVNKFYTTTAHNFATFARESYMTAKEIQEIAEAKDKKLQSAIELLDSYSFAFVKVRNEASTVEWALQTLSMYRRFLYNMAPLAWREKYDEEFGRCSYYFDKYEEDSSVSEIAIFKKIVALFKDKQSRLYFKRPAQLMTFFEYLGRQCLNYMQIDAYAFTISRNVFKGRDYLKHVTAREIELLEESIEINKRELKWAEEEEENFKNEFEKLLLKEFYELYASYDSSKLFTCVQYVNTQIFGYPEDPRDNLFVLAQQLESLYIELTSGLDSLNQEVVKAATNEYFAEDLRAMKSAKLAQRQLQEWKILRTKLLGSFEPPRYKKVNKTARKSV